MHHWYFRKRGWLCAFGCADGKYIATSAATACTSCSFGKSTWTQDTSDVEVCVNLCFTGYTKGNGGGCLACAFGTYKPEYGWEPCTVCPTGMYTETQVAKTTETCVLWCDAGYTQLGV